MSVIYSDNFDDFPGQYGDFVLTGDGDFSRDCTTDWQDLLTGCSARQTANSGSTQTDLILPSNGGSLELGITCDTASIYLQDLDDNWQVQAAPACGAGWNVYTVNYPGFKAVRFETQSSLHLDNLSITGYESQSLGFTPAQANQMMGLFRDSLGNFALELMPMIFAAFVVASLVMMGYHRLLDFFRRK